MLGLWWVAVVWPFPSPRPHPRPLSRPAGEGGMFVVDEVLVGVWGVWDGVVVFVWGVCLFAKVCFASFAVLGPFTNGPYG